MRACILLLLLLTPGLAHAQGNDTVELPSVELEPLDLPFAPTRTIDPGAVALLGGGGLVVSGVLLGGFLAMGVVADEWDAETGAAIVGGALISTLLAVFSSVALGVGLTGQVHEVSRWPEWAWVGAAMAAAAAALSVIAVADAAVNGFNDRTTVMVVAGAFTAVGALPVFGIGTLAYE